MARGATPPEDRDGRPGDGTLTAEDAGPRFDPSSVRKFRLTQIDGPGRGRVWESSSDRCAIGAHGLSDLVVEDPTVSRFHCEVRVGPLGPMLRDLGSHNGTLLDGVRVVEAVLREGSVVRIGRVSFRFELGADQNRLPLSERRRFGALVGASAAMRMVYALLERAAASDATVLLEGETGTGKTAAARAIHGSSARSDAPFILVDCATIPGPLLESELFGHEKGAFTGASARRVGAFEEASGGTVLLDELSELPPELQPKLLRVIEERVVRRIGANRPTPVDVRLLAATNRDLRAEVNAGRFRSDLFFRAAVVRISLPPLRNRLEDLPAIVEQMLPSLGATPEQASALSSLEFIASLRRSAWPGNVRELRNHVERCLVLHEALPPADAIPPSEPDVDPTIPYADARRRALDAFERAYARRLLALHGGRITPAANAAMMDRVYLYRLLKRHGIKT